MKEKLKYYIKFFRLIEYFFLAILLYFFRNYISILLIKFLNIKDIDLQNKIISITPLLLMFIYVILFLNTFFDRFYTYYTMRNFKHDKKEFHRSYSELFRYFKDDKDRKLSFPNCKKNSSWKNTSGFILGRDKITKNIIALDNLTEGINTVIYGSPGSGKTACIITSIIGWLKQKHTSKSNPATLILDIKGDIGNYIKQYDKTLYEKQFITFNPTNINGAKFDPFRGYENLEKISDRKLFIENIANILIQDPNPGSEGSYFVNTGRIIFMGISHMLLSAKPSISFPQVVKYILNCNVFDVISSVVNQDTDENNTSENIIDYSLQREYLGSLFGNNERNIAGAFQNLCSNINIYSNDILSILLDKDTSENTSVCIDTLEKGKSILIEIPQHLLNIYSPLVSLLTQQLLNDFSGRKDSSKENNPILVCLDEFPTLRMDIRSITSMLATLRSRHVSICIICQSLAQLFALYGNFNTMALVSCMHINLILGGNDVESNKFLAELIGYKKALKVSTSYSNNNSSKSISEVSEYIIDPQEISLMTKTKTAIIVMNGKYLLIDKLNAYRDK